jgi:hypothetical protein
LIGYAGGIPVSRSKKIEVLAKSIDLKRLSRCNIYTRLAGIQQITATKSTEKLTVNTLLYSVKASKIKGWGRWTPFYFPIWWYIAPTIINTFLEQYDLSGKTIVPLATSGSSGMGKTNQELAPSCPGAILKEGRRFAADAGEDELKAWANDFIG